MIMEMIPNSIVDFLNPPICTKLRNQTLLFMNELMVFLLQNRRREALQIDPTGIPSGQRLKVMHEGTPKYLKRFDPS